MSEFTVGTRITVTIDIDRLRAFGGDDESIGDFFNRMENDALAGREIVWTSTIANVGTIDKLVPAPQAIESTRAKHERWLAS